ncbi:Subtilase family protein, partial [bacterium A37T11]
MNIKKELLYLAISGSILTNACAQPENPDWQHLDLENDGVFGISDDRAYVELLRGKPANPVIVAVLDGGIDIQQEDLKSVLWVNKKEKPGNGVDDDGNGYVDDVYGWNFVGTPDSTQQYDNMELTRQVRLGRQRFGRYNLDKLPADYRNAFTNFLALQTTLDNKRQETKDQLENLQKLKITIDAVVKQLGKEAPTLQDFLDFSPKNDGENQVRSLVNLKMKRKTFAEFYQEDILDIMERMQNDLDYHYSLNYVPAETHAGNADVTGPDALHGTHVAGIIAADRNNSVGIHGIANHVQ